MRFFDIRRADDNRRTAEVSAGQQPDTGQPFGAGHGVQSVDGKRKTDKRTRREPTPEEISKELGLTRKEVVLALEAIVDPVSLFDPVYSDDSDTLYVMDQVSDKSDCDTKVGSKK